MSESIKWGELTPAQRDECIHEKVMGHTRTTAPHTCPTRNGGTLTYKTGGQDVPRYTTSLDAAWKVIEHITRLPSSQEGASRGVSTQFMIWFENADVWACSREEVTQEICVAALRACGYAVIV